MQASMSSEIHCIAIKAGSGERGLREGKPSQRITIHNCLFKQGHGGVVIGSETAGGISDVLVDDCSFEGTDRGIRLKTRRGRGGAVSNLRLRNLKMEGVLCPITMNMYYRCGAKSDEKTELFSPAPRPVSVLTPHLHDIEISGLEAHDCRSSAEFIAGLPEAPIAGIKMEHCHIGLARQDMVPVSESEMFEGIPDTGERGIRIRHASCEFRDVRVMGLGNQEKPFVNEEGSEMK